LLKTIPAARFSNRLRRAAQRELLVPHQEILEASSGLAGKGRNPDEFSYFSERTGAPARFAREVWYDDRHDRCRRYESP
jgi:hypothetical protein